MKTLLTVLITLVILSSCTTHADRISKANNVEQYTKIVLDKNYLFTAVRYGGDRISLEIDDITTLSTDSIFAVTKLRHDNAYDLLAKLKELNKSFK